MYFDNLSRPQNFEISAILCLLFEGVPTTVLHIQRLLCQFEAPECRLDKISTRLRSV